MEKEIIMLETMNSMVLDLFTIEELVEKGIKKSFFKWKFNFENINLIPVLELYDDKGKIFKTIESTEFSKLLQDLLRETCKLHNEIRDPEIKKEFLGLLEEDTADCSECEFREICFLRDDE